MEAIYSFLYPDTYLNSGEVWSEGDVGLLHVRGPWGEQGVTELLVKVTSVGHECWCKHDVTTDSAHLTLECLAASLPAFLLISKAAQKGLATLNLQVEETHNMHTSTLWHTHSSKTCMNEYSPNLTLLILLCTRDCKLYKINYKHTCKLTGITVILVSSILSTTSCKTNYIVPLT